MSTDIEITTFVGATSEKVWAALTDPARIQAYHYSGMHVEALPEGGHRIKQPGSDDTFIREALVSKKDGERLELTFEPMWVESATPSSTVSWELSEEAEATKVTFRQTNCATMGIGDNWHRFMSSLKSYVETGDGLRIPVPKRA
ncbi:MAG: SRPBCC domain-containing protein [Myxococcota bacterium]